MVIVNCCGVQICTVIIYIVLHVYLDNNNNIKTGIWPEEIESFHTRQRTMVALEESLLELGIARGIYVPFIIRKV